MPTDTIDYETCALLLIDVQQGLAETGDGARNNPAAETKMAKLLAAFRQQRGRIVHVRHDSTEAESLLRPELPGNDYQEEVRPQAGETEFSKSVNSAFIGTGLEEYLRGHGIDALVIVGLTTDHCVSATTRMASDLGFSVTLVADATAAFARCGYDGVHYSGEQIHRVNLVSLDGEFCRVRDTDAVLAELQAG